MASWDDDPVVQDSDLAQQLTALGRQRAGVLDADTLQAYAQQQQQNQPAQGYQQDPQAAPMAWSDVGKQAARNVIPSAVHFGTDIIQPVIHPINTATNLYDVGAGLLEKAGVMNGDDHVKYADAVGQYFADRYGGIENIKRAIAQDPVGVVGDVTALLSGGETALARAPGILGRAGEIAGTAARVIDPLTNAGRVGGAVASGAGFLARQGLGLTTGVGPEALRTAEAAGREGGQAAQTFRENITGEAPHEDAVIQARQAMQNWQKMASQDYRNKMAQLGKNPTILSWNDVDTALNDVDKIATFKGQSRMAPGIEDPTEAMRNTLRTQIDWWKNRQASVHWTPEGFDALKQSIGLIRDQAPWGSPARKVADTMYNAVKDTIIKQDAVYGDVMRGYRRAQNVMDEIEGTLSVNPNARIDTSLRKLQSVLRNDVSSNYGYRGTLLQFLQNAGAPHLMERLAGQALGTWTPRGLGRVVAGGVPTGTAGLAAAMGGGLLGSTVAGLTAAVPTLAAASPRLMGEAAYTLGAARRYAGEAGRYLPLRQLAEPARQIGRQDPRQQAIRIRPLGP